MADSCSLTLHHSWPLLLQRVFLSFALSRNPFQCHTTKTEQQTSLWSVFTRTDTRGQADRPHITLLGTLQAETPFILFLIKDGKGGFPQSRPATEVTAARTSGLDDLVFSRQTGFSSANIRLLISRWS